MQSGNVGTTENRDSLALFILVLIIGFVAIIKIASEGINLDLSDISHPNSTEVPDQIFGITPERVSSYRAARFNHPLQTNTKYTVQSSSTLFTEKWIPTVYDVTFINQIPWYELHRYRPKNRLAGWRDGNSLYKSLSLSYG